MRVTIADAKALANNNVHKNQKPKVVDYRPGHAP